VSKQTLETRDEFDGARSAIGAGRLAHGLAVACAVGVTVPEWDGELRVWDLGTRKPMGPSISSGHVHQLMPVVLCELGGRPLVGVGGRSDVRFWDVETGSAVGRLDVGDQTVHGLAAREIGNDVLVLVTGVVDMPMQVWSLRGGHAVSPLWHPWNLPGNVGNPVKAVDVGGLDENPVIAFGDDDETVFMYDLERSEVVRTITLPEEAGIVTHLAILDPVLATAGYIYRDVTYAGDFGTSPWWTSVWLWEVAGNGRAGEYFPSGRPTGVAIGPDENGHSVVVIPCREKVHLWYPWA
jgi:WD40 repeat protein